MVYVGLRAPPLPHCNFINHVLLGTGPLQRDLHDSMHSYSKSLATLSVAKRVGQRDFVLSAQPPVLLDLPARMTRAGLPQGSLAPGSGYDPRPFEERIRPREPSRFLTKTGFAYATKTRFVVPNQTLGAACVDRINIAPSSKRRAAHPADLSRLLSPPKVMEQFRSVEGALPAHGWDERNSDISSL